MSRMPIRSGEDEDGLGLRISLHAELDHLERERASADESRVGDILLDSQDATGWRDALVDVPDQRGRPVARTVDWPTIWFGWRHTAWCWRRRVSQQAFVLLARCEASNL